MNLTDLVLGRVSELGRFPDEPYEIRQTPGGEVYRADGDMRLHNLARRQLIDEVEQRVAVSPRKEVVLYIHGLNETFASAAFTSAELCHFLGRESVCAFVTWPASASGNS
ncbi:MAG: alpha/beta hydrolase [Thiohalocapsa sp.]